MDRQGRIHIILVDDEEVTRDYGEQLLHRDLPADAVIHTCDDGLSAYQTYRALKEKGANPDVLITDRQMEHMDGFALLTTEAIKADRYMLKIMYSGLGSKEDEQDFKAAPGQAGQSQVRFVEKPGFAEIRDLVKDRVSQILNSGRHQE